MITKYLKLSLLAFTVGCGFVATSLTSCQMKEDDLFDVDPANRADAWMADYRRVFNNNEHGWALYTDNPTSGHHPAVYTFAVKFDQYYSTFYQSSTTQRLANPDDRAADSIRSMYSPATCRLTSSSASNATQRTKTPSSVTARPSCCRL